MNALASVRSRPFYPQPKPVSFTGGWYRGLKVTEAGRFEVNCKRGSKNGRPCVKPPSRLIVRHNLSPPLILCKCRQIIISRPQCRWFPKAESVTRLIIHLLQFAAVPPTQSEATWFPIRQRFDSQIRSDQQTFCDLFSTHQSGNLSLYS